MSRLKILFVIIFSLCISTAFAQTRAELERRKAQLNEDIESINSTLRKTSTNKRVTLKQLNALRAQIRLREEKIRTINSEVRLLDGQINENSNTVRSLQVQLSQLRKDYAAMIVFAQKNQSSYSKLMYVFAAADFNQAYKRLKYLQQFGEYRMKQAGYIEETKTSINQKITQLNRNKKEKDVLRTDEEREKLTLGSAKDRQSKTVSTLSKQEKELKRELSQKRRDAQRLDRAIRAAIQREIEIARRKAEEEARAAAAKAKAEGKAAPEVVKSNRSILASTPEAAKLSADFVSNRGRLPWPVANGVITEGFGTSKVGNVTVNNEGIKIKTTPGASVRAVFEGTVSFAAELSGTYVVLIRHGEYFTVYQNLRSVSVSKGQKVSTKQSIGTAGTDTEGDGEVEFQLRKNEYSQNPTGWIAR